MVVLKVSLYHSMQQVVPSSRYIAVGWLPAVQYDALVSEVEKFRFPFFSFL
jgi:hypothetical protein